MAEFSPEHQYVQNVLQEARRLRANEVAIFLSQVGELQLKYVIEGEIHEMPGPPTHATNRIANALDDLLATGLSSWQARRAKWSLLANHAILVTPVSSCPLCGTWFYEREMYPVIA